MSLDSLDQKEILGQSALLYCTLHHYRQGAIVRREGSSLAVSLKERRGSGRDREKDRRRRGGGGLLCTAVGALYFVTNQTVQYTLLERKYIEMFNECQWHVIIASGLILYCNA